ncbi:MAG: hypothetical protein IJ911_13910 [Salinivirgaceae bacterium]|nr:hypothetical protein [Salinivirgaceae bacterium]
MNVIALFVSAANIRQRIVKNTLLGPFLSKIYQPAGVGMEMAVYFFPLTKLNTPLTNAGGWL